MVYILLEVLDTKNVEVSPTGEVKERMSAKPVVKPWECAPRKGHFLPVSLFSFCVLTTNNPQPLNQKSPTNV